jgi:anti-sigma regulatory factor (Ser/Thr protein kinase)
VSVADAHEEPSAALLVHEALLYRTLGEFVEVAAAFVREGHELGERVLVITDEEKANPLRDVLGDAADAVDWVDMRVWYPKPIDRIQALNRYVHEQLASGVERVRIINESTWPQEATAVAAELKRFESVCNLVFSAMPVWMICPYEAEQLDHVLPDAYRTHPVIRDARVSRTASVAYLQPGEFFKALDVEHELAQAPSDARVLHSATPVEARALVVAEATTAGLHPDRVSDFELAVCEMVTNALRHAHQGGVLRVWAVPEEIVCQVSDTGGGMADPLIGYGEPARPGAGGWGLLLARRLCDGVEVRTTPLGTVIQLSMKLPGTAHAAL